MYHEAYEVRDNHRLIVFTVDRPADTVDANGFVVALEELLDQHDAKFSINTKVRDDNTLVIVAGDKDVLDGVPAMCGFRSERIVEFMRATQTKLVETRMNDGLRTFELPKEWLTRE